MPDLNSIARWLILVGLVIVAIGGILWIAARAGIPLGKLPGDIRIQRENVTCIVPIVSSILLSILLTLVLNIILRLVNK
ncbi:MAG: DUF2905 family protein [Anaerolineales bacterium]|nr:DUF2905 family protein [Anaerolineales bacterium]